MKKRLFVLFCALSVGQVQAQLAAPVKRPNVLLIVADDMNWDTPGCFGGAAPGITPNIERLASEGLTFNHAFSAAPVCSVARTTLATAMHAPRVGFQYHRKSALATLPPGVKPWSQVLRDLKLQAEAFVGENVATVKAALEGAREAWGDEAGAEG